MSNTKDRVNLILRNKYRTHFTPIEKSDDEILGMFYSQAIRNKPNNQDIDKEVYKLMCEYVKKEE